MIERIQSRRIVAGNRVAIAMMCLCTIWIGEEKVLATSNGDVLQDPCCGRLERAIILGQWREAPVRRYTHFGTCSLRRRRLL